MTEKQVMVRQWSFSPYFEGQKPDEQGRYSVLIPLDSLPKGAGGAYKAAQKDFIEEQRKSRKGQSLERLKRGRDCLAERR